MPRTVSVRLDDRAARELEEHSKEFRTDRSETLRRVLAIGLRESRLRRALDLLRARKISIGRAAELAGVSLYEMLDAAGEAGVAYAYGVEDLARDLIRLGWPR